MSTSCTYDFDDFDWERLAAFLERLVQLYRTERPWRDRAACRFAPERTREFFPTNPKVDTHPLCNRCPVRRECADYAVQATIVTVNTQGEGRPIRGLWGGTNEQERRDRRG